MTEADKRRLAELWKKWMKMPLGDPMAPATISEIRYLEQLRRENEQ